MKKYIWQNSEYPNFTYDKELILPLLSSVRLKQGMLLGKMQQLGFEPGLTFGVELEFGLLEADETLLWDYVCGNFRKEDFHISALNRDIPFFA